MGDFCFRKILRKLPENKGKVLFYETYFEGANIDREQLIWSHYKIITTFGQKKWVSLVLEKFTKTVRKLRKSLFYETYFEESYNTGKQHIWPNYKIITKFRPIKWVSFVLEKVYENGPKIK